MLTKVRWVPPLGLSAEGRLLAQSLQEYLLSLEAPGALEIASGKYTPTLTGVTNVTSTTASQCQWSRVGDVVTVSGFFVVEPTATTLTQVGVSLPIASRFSATNEAKGVTCEELFFNAGFVQADVTNDRVQVDWVAGVSGTDIGVNFIFSYLIIL